MRPIFVHRTPDQRAAPAALNRPMKTYSEYTAEELAMERLFIRWVRHPNDPKVADYWVDWVRKNPHQAETVESAKRLVDTVSDWEGHRNAPR